MFKAGLPLAILAVLLYGCSAFLNSAKPGDTQGEVRAKWGEPTEARVSSAGEDLWEYWGGYMGRNTYIVRFGADARAISVAQVLTEGNFWNLKRGASQADVRDTLGRPYYKYGLAGGEVWEYRIYDDHYRYAKMAVQFGQDGAFKDVSKILEDFLYKRTSMPITPKIGINSIN